LFVRATKISKTFLTYQQINKWMFQLGTFVFFLVTVTVKIEGWTLKINTGCSFKFFLKVGVEESIVNALLVSLQSKHTNNAKSEVTFKQPIRDL
jgi:hypothetical protein